MFNLLKKCLKLKIPLTQITYNEREVGFSFYWNQIQLLVPYHCLPVKSSLGPILEEFKSHLEGELIVELECQWPSIRIEIQEIKMSQEIMQQFSQIVSRIDDVLVQIISLVEKDSITFERAQIVLYQKGFQLNDDKVHRILFQIVQSLSPKKVVEEISLPLSNLTYHSGGIRFLNKHTPHEVKKERLPVEVGPALERIKSNFTGDITFKIENTLLINWDKEKGGIQSGHVGHEIKDIIVNPRIPRIFKTLRNQMICDTVKSKINHSKISLNSVKKILEEWGLSLKHQEISYEIISAIEPWIEESDMKIPLKNIIYQDNAILVPLDDHNIKISKKNLAFETHSILETIKERITGEIRIHLYQSLHFIWDEENHQLKIDPQKSVKIKINVDDDTLMQFKEFFQSNVLGISNLERINLDNNKTLVNINGEAIAIENNIQDENKNEELDNINQNNRGIENQEEQADSQQSFIDIPRPIEKVPNSALEEKNYNRECIYILEKLADEIYITTRDLWFKIGDFVIWESAEERAETYIFEWPEEDIVFFVGKIWISELTEIRREREDTGYIKRIAHTPENISLWEKSLLGAIKKKK